MPRGPEHGLAFVDSREVDLAGDDGLLGTTVAGRFVVMGRLGAGSMGAVYRARQEAVGRDVALKIVRRERAYDAETKARFEREARATSSLISPHTVTVFDFGEAEDGSWYMAMELMEGETLGERLRRYGQLPVVDAVRMAREALKSLGEAHAKGIVHRDLKPDNLFLMQLPGEAGAEGTEVCKVLDFGIAKLVRGDLELVDQLETQAGTVFGTPRYMSPEQAQGSKLDARSDLYSLGVILYQALTGRAPFVDDDAVVVMARHIKDPPPAFSAVCPSGQIPPAVEAVVRRALAKDPDQRPQTAEQLSAELEAAASQGVMTTGVHATWAGPPNAPTTPRKTSKAPLIAALALLATALAGIAGFLIVKRFAAPQPTLAATPTESSAASAAPVESSAMSGSEPTQVTDLELDLAPESGGSSATPDAAVAPRPAKRWWPRASKKTAKPAPAATATASAGRYGRFE